MRALHISIQTFFFQFVAVVVAIFHTDCSQVLKRLNILVFSVNQLSCHNFFFFVRAEVMWPNGERLVVTLSACHSAVNLNVSTVRIPLVS